MKWTKKGVIFSVDNNYPWMKTHAQIPVPDILDDGRIRIFFGTRDELGRTSTAYLEVEADNPSNVLYVHDKPVLSMGKLGTFDDCGAMPSCLVKHDGKTYLYYIGWNVSTTVRYRNSIGVAIYDEDQRVFNRLYEGPVMDRTPLEPHFVVTPYIMIEQGIWKMWYCGCTGWAVENGVTEPQYQIKYAESADGIQWRRENTVCIPYGHEKEANARPSVFFENGIYRMWYCYRSMANYRTQKEQSYRVGYAESSDGITWSRQDDKAGIDISPASWDAEMIAYPYVYEYKGRKYMLYNGNGFGRSGFGYAILEED